MTEELSLDEMLAFAERVEYWERADYYTGSLNGINVDLGLGNSIKVYYNGTTLGRDDIGNYDFSEKGHRDFFGRIERVRDLADRKYTERIEREHVEGIDIVRTTLKNDETTKI